MLALSECLNMSAHPHELQELSISDRWDVSQGFLDDKVMIIRIRRDLNNFIGHPGLPNRLRIVWEYHRDNDSGLPDPADAELMDLCEGQLSDALELRNEAILTHVLTCDGLRQWVFYCGDVGVAGERLNSVLPHDEPYPIEITAETDEEWAEYSDTIRTIES
jgi:hypothetical protein